MKKIIVLFLALISGTLFAGIHANLNFSTDGGKTWSEDFPILQKTRKFIVKADFRVEENREFTNNPIIVGRLFSKQDFASANRGRLSIFPTGKGCYFQNENRYYRSCKRPGNFTFTVDLGERKEGTRGSYNHWDRTTKKWISAPLPPLNAYPKGTYSFTVSLAYYVKETPKPVIEEKTFNVLIKE